MRTSVHRVGFITGCLAGMDRRPNAAWVSSPVVWPGWIAGRTPPGFHHRLLSLGTLPARRNVPRAVRTSDPSLRHHGLRPTASKSRRPAGRTALTYRGNESRSDAERNVAVRHMENSQSRITSQGQVSIPVRIRRKLGLTPGSTVEWCERGPEVVVRRATRFSSLDIHRAVFPSPPEPRTVEEMDAGIRTRLRRRHARA